MKTLIITTTILLFISLSSKAQIRYFFREGVPVNRVTGKIESCWSDCAQQKDSTFDNLDRSCLWCFAYMADSTMLIEVSYIQYNLRDKKEDLKLFNNNQRQWQKECDKTAFKYSKDIGADEGSPMRTDEYLKSEVIQMDKRVNFLKIYLTKEQIDSIPVLY